ncbi:hypothetical protein B0H12DRAFT_1244514 [Mycena haematopus]|nr:hypothetical protein B0H12DRAFT_1244514 [Mycena haematopus]
MLSFALGPLSNRQPQYQNQYMLVNENGWLRLSAVSRRALALPPEILAEIFLFCLPSCAGLPNIPYPNDAPLVLCGVCRLWRHVALTTPQLWSSIYIDPESEFDWDDLESGALYVDLCRVWLSRAQSTPLSLYFYSFMPCGQPLLELVSGLAQQWQHIEVGSDILFTLPVHGNYPLLEKLRIFPPPLSHPVLRFHDAPRLRDVYIPTYTTRIQLPWQQLTTFRTDHIEIENCLEFFRHASNLVEARVIISAYHSSALPTDTIFPLLQLQTLNLGGETHNGAMKMTVLKCLKTPALKTLALGSLRSDGRLHYDTSPFLSFVSQSSFQLHTLMLSFVPATVDALIKCLKATPSVVHLKLQIRPFMTNMNKLFAKLTGHRDFLPKLDSLHIAFTQATFPVDVSLVISVLIWRCMTAAAARLQFFRFTMYESTASKKAFESLKSHPVYLELEASGTDLWTCISELSGEVAADFHPTLNGCAQQDHPCARRVVNSPPVDVSLDNKLP